MTIALPFTRSHCILRFTSIGVLAGILGRCTGFAFQQIQQQQRQPMLPRQSPRFTSRIYQPALYIHRSVMGRNKILPHRYSSSLLFSSSSSSRSQTDTDTESNTNTDETSRPMNVAVVGAGAVGSYYGARLWETGHAVTFYMRGEHYDSSKRDGLTVTSVDGDIRIPADRLHTVNDTSAMTTPMDWVVVALKSSSLEAIPDLIYPMLSPDTRILVIMNGLVEDDIIKMLKERAGETDLEAPLQCCRALYGGMAVICVNRLAPGRIDHSFAGLLATGVACSRTEDPIEDQAAFEDLWAPSLVKTDFEQCLLRGRWKKMVWNLPFNGISVAMGGITIDRIVTDPDLRRLVDIVMDEVIATANADLERKYGSEGFDALGDTEKKLMMGLSDNMGAYRTSTMIDLTERRSMEVQYLFGKPVERAHELGVPVPHLETLVAQIGAFQRFYGLF